MEILRFEGMKRNSLHRGEGGVGGIWKVKKWWNELDPLVWVHVSRTSCQFDFGEMLMGWYELNPPVWVHVSSYKFHTLLQSITWVAAKCLWSFLRQYLVQILNIAIITMHITIAIRVCITISTTFEFGIFVFKKNTFHTVLAKHEGWVSELKKNTKMFLFSDCHHPNSDVADVRLY